MALGVKEALCRPLTVSTLGLPTEANWAKTSHDAVPYFSAFQTGLSSTLVTVHSWSVLGGKYSLCFKFSWWQHSNWVEWNRLTISETELNMTTEQTSSCSPVRRSQPLALRSTQRQAWLLPPYGAFTECSQVLHIALEIIFHAETVLLWHKDRESQVSFDLHSQTI